MRDAAFITGASSGIGLATAKRMLAGGMVVFAGVRKEKDAAALAALGATPVRVDITNAEQLTEAVASVRGQLSEELRLSVLVNNAGIVVTAPLEFVDLERLRWQMEVNVIAQVAVTQAFLPLLRESGGRIVFIGSTAGYLSAPFVGAYSASKFAIEAIADSLRMELAPSRIAVSLVQPGAIATPIWDKSSETADADIAALPEAGQQQYASAIAKLPTMVEGRKRMAIPADRVADKVWRASTARRPKDRYRVGLDAHAQYAVSRLVPQRILDWVMVRATN